MSIINFSRLELIKLVLRLAINPGKCYDGIKIIVGKDTVKLLKLKRITIGSVSIVVGTDKGDYHIESIKDNPNAMSIVELPKHIDMGP